MPKKCWMPGCNHNAETKTNSEGPNTSKQRLCSLFRFPKKTATTDNAYVLTYLSFTFSL